MARYSGAIWKPITAYKGRQQLTVHNRMNLHVAVSEAPSLHGYFNKSGIPDSHFYVRRDGTIEQYVDTSLRAFADLEGNDATISVETQGMGPGGWTPEQRESLARLYAWAVETHGIARKMATNSKPGETSQGLSWHRLGCDGNFPALPSILAGRTQRGGGMHYSTSLGKVCPGDDRIEQIPGIFARAMEILGGGSADKEEGFLMALSDKAQEDLADTVRKLEVIARRSEDRQRELIVMGRAQTAAIEALAASQGLDPAEVTKTVGDAVARALKGIEVTLTTE